MLSVKLVTATQLRVISQAVNKISQASIMIDSVSPTFLVQPTIVAEVIIGAVIS
ncbi:hypothetical protein HOG21_07200 [bacterium]|nr:hypothetical protein [bacterium]